MAAAFRCLSAACRCLSAACRCHSTAPPWPARCLPLPAAVSVSERFCPFTAWPCRSEMREQAWKMYNEQQIVVSEGAATGPGPSPTLSLYPLRSPPSALASRSLSHLSVGHSGCPCLSLTRSSSFPSLAFSLCFSLGLSPPLTLSHASLRRRRGGGRRGHGGGAVGGGGAGGLRRPDGGCGAAMDPLLGVQCSALCSPLLFPAAALALLPSALCSLLCSVLALCLLCAQASLLFVSSSSSQRLVPRRQLHGDTSPRPSPRPSPLVFSSPPHRECADRRGVLGGSHPSVFVAEPALFCMAGGRSGRSLSGATDWPRWPRTR